MCNEMCDNVCLCATMCCKGDSELDRPTTPPQLVHTSAPAVQLREEIMFEMQEYVHERAAELARNPPQEDFERPDFTELSLAIDDPTTSEVDDAVRIEKIPEGGWRVIVHVADPSAYVHNGDPLDLEALNRCVAPAGASSSGVLLST